MTLTYRPECLPRGGTLIPDHLSGFVKRVRGHIGFSNSVRFYGVGEYGDRNGRPHYHLLMFGLGPRYSNVFADCWPYNDKKECPVDVLEITSNLCSYICGYVMKGMTKKNDHRLVGRAPEFVRMSRKPGVGASAIPALVSAFTGATGCESIRREGEIPFQLKRGGRKIPLDRYMRGKVRDALGYEKRDFKDTATGIKQAAKLRLVRQDVSVASGREANVKIGWYFRNKGLASREAYRLKHPYADSNRRI